jgi:regulatory protein
MEKIVTALQIQQRRRDRVNVFLDDAYAFSLQDIVAARLRRGQTLEESEIAALRQQDEVELAYEGALHYLSFRPRSEKEVRAQLSKKEVPEEAIAEVLGRLRRAGLVKDEEFARFWVGSREAARPRGTWALRAELQRKGVANEVIATALENVDEETNALNAARRTAQRLGQLDEPTFRRRLLGFLQRRGFGYEVSQKAVRQLWQEVDHTAGEVSPEQRAMPDES